MTVIVHIENDYEDGYRSESDVELPAPGADVEAWWEDVVFPHTGDGHGVNPGGRTLDACYTATVIAGEPDHVGLSNEWIG